MVDIEELVSRGVDGLEVPGGHAIHPLLQPLFPGGLMPAVYRLDGASSVGLGLLTHGWCGVVGLPELSVEAWSCHDWCSCLIQETGLRRWPLSSRASMSFLLQLRRRCR